MKKVAAIFAVAMLLPGAAMAGGTSSVSGAWSASGSQSSTNVNIAGTTIPNNTPNVAAPSFGSANTCALGAGIGVGGPGWGFSAGGGSVDKKCELRADTAMLYTLAGKYVAIQHLCLNSDDLRRTLSAEGMCAQPATGSAPAAKTETAYDKCIVESDGRLHVRPRPGADPQAALAQCQAAQVRK